MFSPTRSRWLRLRLRLSIQIYKECSSPKVRRLSPHRIVKFDRHLSEIKALELVAEKTTIPVPKIVEIHPIAGSADLVDVVYKFVPGETLARAWQHLGAEEKRRIVAQLADYIEQLRSLVPPEEGHVANVALGPAYDHRLGSRPFGPFKCIADFHTFVRQGSALDGDSDSEVRLVHGRFETLVTKFSHADLSPENVIVNKGEIVAILDWEFAGWWPEYWEYTKIHYGYRDYRADFYKELDNFVHKYPDELAAELALWKRYDTFSYDRDLYKWGKRSLRISSKSTSQEEPHSLDQP